MMTGSLLEGTSNTAKHAQHEQQRTADAVAAVDISADFYKQERHGLVTTACRQMQRCAAL